MPFNANRALRTLKKMAIITAASRSQLGAAQQIFSDRVDVPTMDSLQLCNQADLDIIKKNLISANLYVPETPTLCVTKETYALYSADNSLKLPEAKTNCYGDALGIAEWLNPGGFVARVFDCDALISGALKDGATFAADGKCQPNSRQMLFFVSKDTLDYHVISRSAKDQTWMQKIVGIPRFPVPFSGAPEHGLDKIRLNWYIKAAETGKHQVFQYSSPRHYTNWCSPMLCSLPEKNSVISGEPVKRPTPLPPTDLNAALLRQTSIALPVYSQEL